MAQLNSLEGTDMKANTYRLAYRVDFDGQCGFKAGRGVAGWTVRDFSTEADRRAFMVDNPQSGMPSWNRIEQREVIG